MSDRTVDILLIGGGIAAASCAHELRERGFQGSVTLVTREQDPPYHRPPITKGYLRGDDDRGSTLIHPVAWYAEHDVELLTRTPVMSLDPAAGEAKVGREVIGFDQALIATGAMVRRLRSDGATRANIHYLRALGNADTLREAVADAQRVVVVGGSYIATEVAASLTALGKPCTLVMQEELPLERGFGPIAGRYVHDLLTSHGVEIVGGADVVAFDGEGDDEAPVGAVVCADGRRIEGDLVVVGAGALPDVMLARKAGLVIGDSGGVCCDKRLQTSEPNVFAAGDMCEYDSELHGRRLRIEHEEVAGAQGRHGARAMLGSDDPFTEVPYFWSDLADWTTLEYVGPAAEWDEEIVHGDPGSGAFSVFYLHEDRLRAALAVGRTDDIEVAAALMVKGANGARVRGVLGGG